MKRRDPITVFIIITAAIIVLVLGLYFSVFHEGLSTRHSDWDAFGSLFGALTGLIAFIGVLITLSESKKQTIRGEERSSFFSMLQIFLDCSKSLKTRATSIDVEAVGSTAKVKVMAGEPDKCGEEVFEQVQKESMHLLYTETINSLKLYLRRDEVEALPLVGGSAISLHYKKCLDNIYKGAGEIWVGNAYYSTYTDLARTVLNHYYSTGNYTALAEIFSHTGNEIFSRYRNELGAFLRNVYYILDMVSGFAFKKNYGSLFRAQLSKNQLIVLFFNSFCQESNAPTRQLYIEYDLFNNMILRDISIDSDEKIDKLFLFTVYDALEKYTEGLD